MCKTHMSLISVIIYFFSFYDKIKTAKLLLQGHRKMIALLSDIEYR